MMVLKQIRAVALTFRNKDNSIHTTVSILNCDNGAEAIGLALIKEIERIKTEHLIYFSSVFVHEEKQSEE
jgi:hypothetical protein